VSIDELIGMTKVIARAGGRMSRRKLQAMINFDDEQIVGIIEFLILLGLVEMKATEVVLTTAGSRVSSSSIPARRGAFAELATRLPVIRDVLDVLASDSTRSLPRSKLLDELGAQTCACAEDAERVFDHVAAWGRYAGLFSYDAANGLVSLP
jgi:NitT/TauT family transport system ATP-binding protein